MFSTHYPAPNSRMQSTTPIWKRLPSRQKSSEFYISTTRMREQSITLLSQRQSSVEERFLRTLSLQKMGSLWRSMRKLTSRGMTGGLENLRVTDPLKSQRYHSFMPKKRFYITMKQSEDMLRLMMKAPQMGVRMLPSCRCRKYLESDLRKVMNSPLGIFLMTSRSLQERMKGEPDLPPVAIQWSAPVIDEMKSSSDILFFLLSISNSLGSMMVISSDTVLSFFILPKMSNIFSCDSIRECIFLKSSLSTCGKSFSMQLLTLIVISLMKEVVCSRQSLCCLLLRAAARRVCGRLGQQGTNQVQAQLILTAEDTILKILQTSSSDILEFFLARMLDSVLRSWRETVVSLEMGLSQPQSMTSPMAVSAVLMLEQRSLLLISLLLYSDSVSTLLVESAYWLMSISSMRSFSKSFTWYFLSSYLRFTAFLTSLMITQHLRSNAMNRKEILTPYRYLPTRLMFSMMLAMSFTLNTSSSSSGMIMSMHCACDSRTSVPTIEFLAFWRASMKLDRGFLTMDSNLEFLECQAMLLIQSQRKSMMLSILLDYMWQTSVIALFSFARRNWLLPVQVRMLCRLMQYLPTKNLTDFEPRSNTLTFLRWVQVAFLAFGTRLLFSRMVVSVEPLNMCWRKLRKLNSKSGLQTFCLEESGSWQSQHSMKHLSFSLVACFQRQVKIISISSFCSFSFWLVKEEQQLLSISALSTIIDSVQILTYWSVEQQTSMCRQLGLQQTVHFLSRAVSFLRRKLPRGVSSSEQNILCSSWMELQIYVKLLNLFLKLCVLPRVYSSSPPLVTSGQLAKSLSTQLICLQLTYFSLMQLRMSQWNSAQKLKNIQELFRQQLLRICSVMDQSRPWSMRTLWIFSFRCVRICSMKRNYFLSDQRSFALLCCITSVMPSSSLAVCTLKNFFRALPYFAETQVAEVIFLIVPVISFQGQASTFPIPSTIFSILKEVLSLERYSTLTLGMTVIELCRSRSSNSFSMPPSRKMMLTLTRWQKEMILFISLSRLFIIFSKEASFSPPTRSQDSMLPQTSMQVMFSYSSLMRLLVKAFLMSTMGSRARVNSYPKNPLILTFWQTFILPVTTKLGGILVSISCATALS